MEDVCVGSLSVAWIETGNEGQHPSVDAKPSHFIGMNRIVEEFIRP